MKRKLQWLFLIVAVTLAPVRPALAADAARFEVSYSSSVHAGPITGRLILVLSKSEKTEPRLLVSPLGPAVFGIDVDQLRPAQPAVVDAAALGYPKRRMSELPPGEYYAQAILHVYTQVRRKDGHTIWVPMNDGRRESFNRAAGNLYSGVHRVRLGEGGSFKLELTSVIPSTPRPADTEWVKRVRIQSKVLTEFWGRPIYIHATVLLPKDYEKRPDTRYPTIFTMIHNVPFSFNPEPPPANARTGINPDTGLETGYQFYQSWISERFPRVIAVAFEQQTPYFPDSYSVNSANNGPYGDAIVHEVIPQLERQFRMIGKPYARIVEGASTGGWQSLALQLKYPDFFGGAWILQPDPIDFRRYQLVNIYEDDNAFTTSAGMFTTAERPMRRSPEGQVNWTMRDLSLFEEVLGSRGRSGYQFEGWEAVYGPVGADGYPRPLWDKLTGKIDREVAHYMRDNGYDLREFAQRNWATLGPKIIGKLHFYCGDMDNFYLNLAVYRFEEFLKSTKDPHDPGSFTYGRPMKSHSWHAWTWAGMVEEIAAYIRKNAPAGESTAAWSY